MGMDPNRNGVGFEKKKGGGGFSEGFGFEKFWLRKVLASKSFGLKSVGSESFGLKSFGFEKCWV